MFSYCVAVTFRSADTGYLFFTGIFFVNTFHTGSCPGNKFQMSGFIQKIISDFYPASNLNTFVFGNFTQYLLFGKLSAINTNKAGFLQLLYKNRVYGINK